VLNGYDNAADHALNRRLCVNNMSTQQNPTEPYALRDTVGTFTRDYTPAYYRVAVPLGAAERAEIAAKTLLTRNQAAARLGISAQTFDRRYTQAGLAPAVHLPGTTNHSGWPSHLYRLADVEALRAQDE